MTDAPGRRAGGAFLPLAPLQTAVLCLAVFVMGGTALIAQVVLARELLALFLGNELSLALVLTVWLVAVAAGSAIGARLTPWSAGAWDALAYSQAAMAVLLAISLFIVRHVQLPGVAPGETPGPGAVLLASLETLGLVAAASGLQFVLACRAGERVSRPSAAGVYALEAAGATAGGLIFHFLLAQSLGPRAALWPLAWVNAISAFALVASQRVRFWPIAAVVGANFFAQAGLGGGQGAELASLRASPRWQGLNPVAFRPSRYGALVVTSSGGQAAIYQSGVLLFTSEDQKQNEITAHFPLLEHPRPRRVLLIGGAGSGLPSEVLKHHVERLDCVELDPHVTALARRWLPAALTRPLGDPRVAVHHGDGRAFIRSTSARYDVILLNLPDPTTAAINRFYSEEFFREAKRALAPGGLLCLGLSGSEIHLSGFVLLSVATLDQTLAEVFPDRLLVPGDRVLFLASARPGLLSSDWQLLSQRLSERDVKTDFVNDVWLRDSLFPFRADLLRQQLAQARSPRINTDLNPVTYYYQIGIWLDCLSSSLAVPVRYLSRVSVWWGAALVALALLVALLWRGPRAADAAVLVATACVGGFGLVVELLCLLVFQSACGYLYHAIGVLIAVFMAGLALGAAALRVRQVSGSQSGELLLAGLVTAALAALALPRLLVFALQAPDLAPLLLGMVLLLAGSLVGAFFPIAAACYARSREAASAAGVVYAADVLGSAAAGLIAGAFAIPLLGVSGTCHALVLALAAGGMLVVPLTALLRPAG